jgi:hypothetical protein
MEGIGQGGKERRWRKGKEMELREEQRGEEREENQINRVGAKANSTLHGQMP